MTMARNASGNFDQTKYVETYMKENMTVKKVAFNNKNDAEMLTWVNDKNFSGYVKGLIRQDMQENKENKE